MYRSTSPNSYASTSSSSSSPSSLSSISSTRGRMINLRLVDSCLEAKRTLAIMMRDIVDPYKRYHHCMESDLGSLWMSSENKRDLSIMMRDEIDPYKRYHHCIETELGSSLMSPKSKRSRSPIPSSPSPSLSPPMSPIRVMKKINKKKKTEEDPLVVPSTAVYPMAVFLYYKNHHPDRVDIDCKANTVDNKSGGKRLWFFCPCCGFVFNGFDSRRYNHPTPIQLASIQPGMIITCKKCNKKKKSKCKGCKTGVHDEVPIQPKSGEDDKEEIVLDDEEEEQEEEEEEEVLDLDDKVDNYLGHCFLVWLLQERLMLDPKNNQQMHEFTEYKGTKQCNNCDRNGIEYSLVIETVNQSVWCYSCFVLSCCHPFFYAPMHQVSLEKKEIGQYLIATCTAGSVLIHDESNVMEIKHNAFDQWKGRLPQILLYLLQKNTIGWSKDLEYLESLQFRRMNKKHMRVGRFEYVHLIVNRDLLVEVAASLPVNLPVNNPVSPPGLLSP